MTSDLRFASCVVLAWIAAGCAPFERGGRRIEPDAGMVADAMSGDAGGASFAADVHPILLDRCGDCHREGGAAAKSEYVLADDPESDREAVLGLIDTDAPDSSELLKKARGEMHGGGSVMPRDSADYATVRAWIAAGAPP